jgi:vacuolar-type H+-ATPase subunit H
LACVIFKPDFSHSEKVLIDIYSLVQKAVLSMLKVFEEIKEKNLEAKRIIERAKEQAEKIRKDAEQKSSEVYEIAHNAILEKAEREVTELKRRMAVDTEHELEKIRSESYQIAERIEETAEKNLNKAVDCVLTMVLEEI